MSARVSPDVNVYRAYATIAAAATIDTNWSIVGSVYPSSTLRPCVSSELDEHDLRPSLPQREEEREQPRAEEEPGRDGHVHGDRPGGGADDEQAGDGEHVDEGDVLERGRVGELHRDERIGQAHRCRPKGHGEGGRDAGRTTESQTAVRGEAHRWRWGGTV